ncbi:MAG: ATP-binding protein [Planctomycetes bacterium]|nr:ATP-binding protein [Planctomycetota bacterium]
MGSGLKLIVRSSALGADRVILLHDERLSVGRGTDQDLCIPDRKISSAHALLEPIQGGYRIRDLGSTNGTYVNGELVQGVRLLAADDEILFGNTRVLYTDREPDGLAWDPTPLEATPPTAAGPALGGVTDRAERFEPESWRLDEELGGPQTVKFKLQDLEQGLLDLAGQEAEARSLQRRLGVLYRMTLLARSFDAQALLRDAVGLLLEAVEADRGSIFLRDGAGQLVEAVSEGRGRGGASRGLLAQALQGGEAILIRDAQFDHRVAANQSIHTFGIRSALVVPLRVHDEVLGALHLDKRESRKPFDQDDLQLAVIVAQQVAAALANARLIDQITRANRELEAARDEILRWNQELEHKVEQRTREVQAQAAKIADLHQQKDQLLGMVAHDLRTPLTGLLGFAEVALVDLDTGGPVREDLDVIRTTALEMNELLSDLLDVAKFEAGKIRLALQEVDLAQVLGEGRRRYDLWAQAKGIAFRLALRGPLPRARVDARRVQQILNNLVSNAVKFSSKGGAITLSAREVDGAVEVSVTDTGQGIEPSEIDRIFGQFEQTSAQPTAGERGSGLGLAIAKKLVELHGGRIWVESKKGVGSKFTFTLPT